MSHPSAGSRSTFDRDYKRQSALTASGWSVLVATSNTDETLFVDHVRGLLRRKQKGPGSSDPDGVRTTRTSG